MNKIEIVDKYFDEYKTSYKSKQNKRLSVFILILGMLLFGLKCSPPTAFSENFPSMMELFWMVPLFLLLGMFYIGTRYVLDYVKYKSDLRKQALKEANIQDVFGFAEKNINERLEAEKQISQSKEESYRKIIDQKDAKISCLEDTIEQLLHRLRE